MPSMIIIPIPIKAVEPVICFQEKAVLLVGVAEVDVEAVVEAEFDVEDDVEVEEGERVTGKEGKDRVGCAVATLQNACARLSIVVT